MDSPALADSAIADGKADMIGMAKTLIVDPHFPNKAKAGKVEDIRQCIACTQSCVGHVEVGLGVGCIYNPVTGREGEWGQLNPAEKQKKVIVVGAGPAGLEAARVAALRGHKVILIERDAQIGGQVNLIYKTPNRASFQEIILWFERQLPKLGVEIRKRTEADAQMVLAENADEIICATGSTAFLPEIDGMDNPTVFSARDALSGKAELGHNIVVVDTLGRSEAITTADYLSELGHRIELLTGLPLIAPNMPSPSRHHLMEKLLTSNVSLTTYSGVWEVNENSLEIYNVITWEPRTIEGVDSIVFGSGGKADDSLFHELRAKHPSVHAIGDCYEPRDIEESIVHGHRLARQI